MKIYLIFANKEFVQAFHSHKEALKQVQKERKRWPFDTDFHIHKTTLNLSIPPRVLGERYFIKDGQYGIRFWCPFCKRDHLHGDGEGHRLAHCLTNSPFTDGGYMLTLRKFGFSKPVRSAKER